MGGGGGRELWRRRAGLERGLAATWQLPEGVNASVVGIQVVVLHVGQVEAVASLTLTQLLVFGLDPDHTHHTTISSAQQSTAQNGEREGASNTTENLNGSSSSLEDNAHKPCSDCPPNCKTVFQT